MNRTDLDSSATPVPRWVGFVVLFGLYLTLRGYHSFDGDQAYRLPLLLHRQDPIVYHNDPFVRAFDVFNPHRGYLALLDAASVPFGLATALATLFALTLVATSIGVDRLARRVWSDAGTKVGLVAVGLVLMVKAGNIGTNHLFESTLLDRLIGFALGWLAIAGAMGGSRAGMVLGAGSIGVAALIHPSVGLQLGLTLIAGWIVWALGSRQSGVSWKTAGLAVGLIALSLSVGMVVVAGQGGALFAGMPAEEFRSLAVLVQGPQHMLPSTWRRPQWIAWGCFPILAVLSLARVGLDGERKPWTPARWRFLALLGVNLASLAAAYVAVEGVGNLRITIFQPFRMATLTRGLAVVALAGRVVMLWERGDTLARLRAALLVVGLAGDRMMAVATAFEVGLTLADVVHAQRRTQVGIAVVVLAAGLYFLVRHDTESGHLPMLAAVGAVLLIQAVLLRRQPVWNRRRAGLALVLAWAVPVLAVVGPVVMGDWSEQGTLGDLVARCRFAEIPTDDLERIAVWCRGHTPEDARFVGPPGVKDFRLWSRRAVAFNRAGSPYHAAGLGDWANRYRDHVGFTGSTAEFVRVYLADRNGLESRFSAMTDAELAGLASRQGASHVLREARVDAPSLDPDGPLERLHTEGRYTVYRVRARDGQGLAGSVGSASRIEPNPAARPSATTRPTL